MIGTIDIAVNAANPQLPLTTLAAYVSSPSHVRVLNVPRGIGAWQLTAVALEIAYPDGAVVSVPATRNGAVWSATFPAPVAPGVSTRGFRVVASGVDENGADVTGYILGMGDVLILDADGSLVIGTRRVAVRIVDEKPESPREGDLVLASMEIFDGAAWRTLGPTPDIGELTRVDPYLYELNNAALDDTFAEAYFRERFEDRPPRLAPSRGADNPPSPLGACSCVRIGNEFARAYDWKYDESVSFLVRTKASGTRFASIAVCRSPEGLTRQALESKTAPANLFRILPYLALDGINENGVTCCVNVVPSKVASGGASAAVWPGRDFCAVGAVRRVLDRARTAEEGAILIASNAWMPSASALGGYSLHFMIADGSKTYVVEDGQIFDISSNAVKAMTNFRVGGRDFLDASGRVDVDKIAAYDPYGTGAERYEALTYRTLHPFAESLREWLTAFKYSEAYFFADTPRPSDFAGVEIEPGVRAKINDTLDIEEWFVDNDIHAKWLARTRDGTFWQTVHSSVYDIAARSLQLVVQEGDAVHTFPIVKSDSEPADYSTVRTNAAAGAAHAAETGNPHGTEIGDISGLTDALGSLSGGIETAAGVAREALETTNNHKNDTSNPHGTTADQVGAYTKGEVDEKISQNAAHYLTARVGGAFVQFATHAALAAAKAAHTEENPQFWYGDAPHTPDKNDYCTVLDDETHGHATTRYMFVGEWTDGFFRYQYTVNPTALTQAQWDALNSGATKEKIEEIDEKLEKTEGVLEAGSFGLSDGSGVIGFFVRKDGGIYIGTASGRIEIPMFKTDGDAMAVLSDIADATKLTPVYGEWTFSGSDVSRFGKLSCEEEPIESAPTEAIYHLYSDNILVANTYLTSAGVDSVYGFTYTDEEGAPQEYDITATRSIVGYTTANGEYVSAQTAADITKVAEDAIKDKAMPTEGAAEGSVSAKITALEGAVSGVETLLADI